MSVSIRRAAIAVIVAASFAPAAEIVPIDRDGAVLITMANLDATPGSTSTGEPIVLDETGLTSFDDIITSGQLYYGPDGFDRVNTGTFQVTQDITVDTGSLAADLAQSASVTGDANPSIDADNSLCYRFTVDGDTDATIGFEFDGDTNAGNDAVTLFLRRVDADDTVLETLFNLAATGQDGSGSGSQAVSLTEGERYKLVVTGRARSLVSIGSTSSAVAATITLVPAPCNDADLAEPFGLLDLADITAFSTAFLAQEESADLVDDGLWDLADINAFVTAFSAGCP